VAEVGVDPRYHHLVDCKGQVVVVVWILVWAVVDSMNPLRVGADYRC
jgi:hypothetical protein